MSRYSGCWVGMKLISDTVETTAAVDLQGEAREFLIPDDFEVPPDGLNLRWPDDRWSQDHRLQNYKGYAAIAFGRANGVDRVVFDCQHPRLGVIASGKAYEDVRQALRELEIDAEVAGRIGLRVYKVGMPWPIEPVKLRHFCEGLDEVLVVEERREIIENQIKQYLFNWRADVRPRIIGKFDHQDHPVLPLDRELHCRPRRRGSGRAHQPSRGRACARRPHRGQARLLQSAERAGRQALRAGHPAALFLLRLPPQHLDPGARGQPRAGRHRLPLHGAVDGPAHRDLHPHGRRGRALGRQRAVHRRKARLRQSR